MSHPDADVIAFNVTSANSGLEAGELVPVSHTGSISLVVNTQALYSLPAVTVTFGNVATYSIMPLLQWSFLELHKTLLNPRVSLLSLVHYLRQRLLLNHLWTFLPRILS